MKPRTRVALVVTLSVIAVVGLVVTVSLNILLPTLLPLVPMFLPVGIVIALKRPENPIGWWMLGVAAIPAANLLVLRHEVNDGVSQLVGLTPELQNGLMAAGLAVVLLLFPTGRLLGRLWSIPLVVVFAGASSLIPGVVDFSEGFRLHLSVIATAAALIWCAVAPIERFRRGTAVERAQLRWFGAAIAFGVLAVVLAFTGVITGVDTLLEFATIPGLMFVVGFPVSIAVAIVRYRLFEIGRLISRTVTFAVVAVAVAAAYAIPVVFVSEVLGRRSPVVTAGATLAAVAIANPFRRRARRAVERRFNRSSYDAMLEVDRLTTVVGASADLDLVRTQTLDLVGRTLQPSSVAFWQA